MANPLASKAGSLLLRRVAKSAKKVAPLRDKAGRFRNVAASDLTFGGGAALSFGKPHSHASCGKGQYKSLECKVKSIMKAAEKRGGATARERQYLRYYEQNG